MRLAADIERLTRGIAALRIVRALIREGAVVGKLSETADRIRRMKAGLDTEADKLGEKLDMIDKAAPVAFQRGHAFIAAQHAEVAEIESTLRQLSNLPLDGAEDLQRGSPAASKLPAAPTLPATPETAQATAPGHRTADPAVMSLDGSIAFVKRTQQP